MTNTSKENLLKILLNVPTENPHENKATFNKEYRYGAEYETDNPLNFDQLQWNGYTIGLNGDLGGLGGYLYLYDNEGKLIFKGKPTFKNTECSLISIDIDENGNLYGLIVYDNELYLTYFNNIFMKTTEGNYELIIKKTYSLASMYQEIRNQIGGGKGTVFNTDIKKSPISGQFVITWAFNTDGASYTLITVLYNVNVGSDNTYSYKSANIGTYDYNWIKSVKVNWQNTSFTMLIMSSDFSSIATDAQFYKITGNFDENSTITSTLILNQNDYYATDYGLSTNTSSKNAVQTENSIYFVSNQVNGTDLITTIYRYTTSLKVIWQRISPYNNNSLVGKTNIVKINNQIFAWCCLGSDTEGKYNNHFMHIIGNEANICNIEDIDYRLGLVCTIQNFFNLYVIYLENYGTVEYKIIYTYKDTYNGEPYYSDTSVTSENLQLFNYSNKIIFDRDLYNKKIIGNSITSITQIPYNYLNSDVVVSESLKSYNNNIIDTYNEEIMKNLYEEVQINNIDTYMVFDNNNGSVFNQNSSLELVNNIFNGFENEYKITHYRVNYSNGHLDRPINHIEQNGTIGKITLYINVENAVNVQLYDENFTTPFVTIDLSNYTTGIYKIEQYVKVE